MAHRSNSIEIIDEVALPAFRGESLAPSSVMAMLRRSVHVLLQLAIGVGKSHAIDRLLASSDLHEFFDLVIYAAPTWAIINEREIVRLDAAAPVSWIKIEPRPRHLCGRLNDEWLRLESQGCSSFAKDSLCRRCPRFESPCTWPSQFARVEGKSVVFCTEQQFVLNPRFYMTLIALSGARRPLLILDEAKIVGEKFEWGMTRTQLMNFRRVVAIAGQLKVIPRGASVAAIEFVDALLATKGEGLADLRFRGCFGINMRAAAVQRIGLDQVARDFHYLGHDLDFFASSRFHERWLDESGTVHFIARPYLDRHLLIAGAHIDDQLVARRLGIGHIDSPFKNVRFAHSKTRIVNLRCRLGARSYFHGNADQILGTIAVLILRNITAKKSTLLVATKDSKEFCADHLRSVLADWGITARFVVDPDQALPPTPDPYVIPVIHYGVLGTNNYQEYESAFCCNSYYVSDQTLMRAIDESEPNARRTTLKIVAGVNHLRQAVIGDVGGDARSIESVANEHLRHLEIDPVLQATGRVRFNTKPRDVLLFGMHDFHPYLAEYKDVRTLADLRAAFGIPTAAEIGAFANGVRISTLIENGATVAAAAARCGISERTAFRRLKACGTAKNPLEVFLKGIWQSDRQSGQNTGGPA